MSALHAVVQVGNQQPPADGVTESLQPTRIIEPVRPQRRKTKPGSRSRWKDIDPESADSGTADPTATDSPPHEADAGKSNPKPPSKKSKRRRLHSGSQLLPESKTITDADASDKSENPSSSQIAVVFERQPIDHLLPPRFDLDDPDRLELRLSNENHKVLLPDGGGGLREIDDRVIRVRYGSEEFQLTNASDQDKQRRRLLTNITTIGILLILLAIVFYFLQRSL